MRIRLSERETFRGPWLQRFDERVSPGETRQVELPPAGEGSEFSLSVFPGADEANLDVEVRVGQVLVSSTRPSDRTDFPLLPTTTDDGPRRWTASGQFLRDWVGVTDLTVDAVAAGVRRTVLRADGVRVSAGKVTQEVFEALCADIAAHSSSMLLDVYGKTYFGLEPELRAGETAPLALLRRLRQAVDRTTAALRDIARRPALRLRNRLVREPAVIGQSVGELTLQEVCQDPTLAVRLGRRGITFREQIREDAVHHFDLPENRLLTGFLHFVHFQIADLRARAGRELERRRADRVWRDRRTDDGPSWWQREDAPRIRELEQELETLAGLDAEVAVLLRLEFLPPAEPLREVPRSSPLFRSHRAYADAFRTMVTHFQSFRVQIDGGHLLARARSLPVLYEVWCCLEVMRILSSCLTMTSGGGDDSPFRRVSARRDRFVIEFDADQWVDYHDRTGRLVRLRYVPRYLNRYLDRQRGYGLLGPEVEMTPDLALELFPAGRADGVPELIVILDAKYSTLPHAQLMERVRTKYGRIGVFASGTVLSRQVWALAPAAPTGGPYLSPAWANQCTVDNLSFWADSFDPAAPVAGVVQARPLLPAPSPLEALLRWTLEREGLVLRG